DVVAESGPLAAYVTYRSHWSSLPNQVITGEMPDVGNRKRVPDRYQRGQLLPVRAGRAPVCIVRARGGSRGSSPLPLGLGVLPCALCAPAGVQGGRAPSRGGGGSSCLHLCAPAGVQGGRPPCHWGWACSRVHLCA